MKYVANTLAIFMAVCAALCSCARKSSLQEEVDALLRGTKADVGVAVCCNGEVICARNAGKHYPMMSVFKLHQALCVLDSIRWAGADSSISLDDKVLITREMLKPDTYSPMRDKYPEGNVELSIGELLGYSLLQSDNNACDILFGMFGGPEYVQDKMRQWGLEHTQIRWTEAEMHIDEQRANENYTTPLDAVDAIQRAWCDPWLNGMLVRCETGRNRLPAGLPKDSGAYVGHKTGTWGKCADGLVRGINDVGFVELPFGRQYFIAVFCNDSSLTTEETEAIIAGVSTLAYNYFSSRRSSVLQM